MHLESLDVPQLISNALGTQRLIIVVISVKDAKGVKSISYANWYSVSWNAGDNQCENSQVLKPAWRKPIYEAPRKPPKQLLPCKISGILSVIARLKDKSISIIAFSIKPTTCSVSQSSYSPLTLYAA